MHRLCLWGFIVYLPIQIITPGKTVLILKHAPVCVCEASLCIFLFKLLHIERLLDIETCPSLCLWGFLVYLPIQIITPRKTALILKHAPACVCEASLFTFLCKLLHLERLSWYWDVPLPVSVGLPCLSSYSNYYTKKDCLCIETCPVCICEASLFIFLCKLLHLERLSWYWNMPQSVSVRLPCLSSYANYYT